MQRALIALAVLAFAFGAAYLLPPAHEAFVQYFVPEPRAVVLFGGDMMFDRSIRQYALVHGGDYLFGCIDTELRQADLAVANLEGPITASTSVSVGSTPGGTGNYTFTFPTTTAALLKAHRIELVNMGNNHIFNFDAAGVRSTMSLLDAAKVGYFGDPLHNTVAERTVGGVGLAFINYNEFLPPGIGTATTTLMQIAAEKAKGYLPVVYAHWGDEYKPAAPARVVSLAHQFVDQGAVAVIGSHPHVVENSETYRGAPIYYSLGNFIFDQYFSAAVTHGLLLRLTFSSSTVSKVEEVPIVLKQDRTVCPVSVTP